MDEVRDKEKAPRWGTKVSSNIAAEGGTPAVRANRSGRGPAGKWEARVTGPDDFARGRPGRDESVRVDPARLLPLIGAAIREMEPF